MTLKKKEIQAVTKKLLIDSFNSWSNNKIKKGIDTEHLILDTISPKERFTATIIQSLQTSLGSFWENLIIDLAKKNSFTIFDNKDFYKPDTNDLNSIIDKWRTIREDKKNISLKDYIQELRDNIKLHIKKYSKIKKIKVNKGDGVDVWMKKNDINYLLEVKSPQINAGQGKEFSHKLMKFYHHHLFWNYNSKIKALVIFPYNPYSIAYEKKQAGRLTPLLINEDFLVQERVWELVTGNKKAFKYINDIFNEFKKNKKLYKIIIKTMKTLTS